jgi:MFS family permease
VLVVAAASFLVAIGFGVIGPAIPLLAAHFGVSAALAGLAISAFAAFRFLSALAGGRLVRAVGERAVMTGGLLLQAVTSILAGLAPTFPLLIAFRSIGGIGSAAFTVSSIALVIRIAPEQQRGRAMGIYQGGFILGSIAGPGLGGLLAEISLRLPLVVYGIFLLLAAIVSATMLRTPAVPRRDRARTEPALAEQVAEAVLAEPAIPGEALADAALADTTMADAPLFDGVLADTPLGDAALGDDPLGDDPLGGAPLGGAPLGDDPLGDAALGDAALGDGVHGDAALGDIAQGDAVLARPRCPAAGRSDGPLRTALRSRAYLAALLANLGVGWVFYGMRSSLLPLYISRHLGQSAGWTGLAFLLSALVQALALLRAGRICDNWGRRPALLLGAGVSILSVAAFTLPISPGVFLLPLLSLGVGGALLATAPGALVGDVAVGRSETIIALFAMVSDFGGIAGPLISGWLTDAVSYAAAFWLACAILAGGFVMTLTIGRGHRPDRVTDAAAASL